VTSLNQTFVALADPTRRAILDVLIKKGGQSITQLRTVNEDITRQAFEKHVGVLISARVVIKRKKGRESMVKVAPSAFMDVALWMKHYEKLWEHKLSKLGTYLDRD